MAPYALHAGTLGYALVFAAIGFGFGALLEMAGFGDTRKLTAQFYLRDLTVLKVMFTAIAVSATLLAGASSLGLLDLGRVWVNPTYLWPGIAGGLVMGVGFILGGFCPGTSVVAASTLKLDGMLFLAGALVGVLAFGETVGSFGEFFGSSAMGRFTLDQWLGLSYGATVLLLAAAAVAMFWAAEVLERRFGRGEAWAAIALRPRSAAKVAGAGALLAAGAVLALRGDPTLEQRWRWLPAEARRAVEERSMFADPAEVVALRKDLTVNTVVLDVRDEHDFNLFHVGGARRVAPADLVAPAQVKRLLDEPASTVTFLAGNGEAAALAAYRRLKALGVQNLYVVEGGVNRWLERYPVPSCVAAPAGAAHASGDALALRFAYAAGEALPASWPELPASRSWRSPCGEPSGAHGHVAWPEHAFAKRVKLQTRSAVKGGCG